MKFTQTPLLLFCFGLLIWSCQNPEKQEVEQLKQQVMAVHDEMMPRMDELYSIKKSIVTKLQTADSISNDSQNSKDTLREALRKVQAGEEAMMQWMRDYKGHTIMDNDSLLLYLKEELPKVEQMKQTMLEGLEAGKEALKGDA